MSSNHRKALEANVAKILVNVEPEWWLGITEMLEGGNPSQQFLEHFGGCRSCQKAFETILRFIDEPLAKLLRERS